MNNLFFIKRIDDLGRIVIPKEIRKILKIDENENMKICLSDDKIVIEKHSLLDENDKIFNLLGRLVNKITNNNIIISNRDKIVYSSEKFKNKEISEHLKYRIINNKGFDNEYDLDICYDIKIKAFYYSKNIIIDSNMSGMIILYSKDKINDDEKKIIDIISELLSR